MFKISHVDIEGFWGKFSASVDFFPDVNILIGKNGTGKTTFMDMLQAVLRVDLPLLYSLEFNSISIKLKQGRKQRTITVVKEQQPERPFDSVTFKVGRQAHTLAIHPRDIERYRYAGRPLRVTEPYIEVKREIDELVNIASLSVHRISYEDLLEDEDTYRAFRKRSERPIIDGRLEQLSQALTAYQLSLAEKEKEISSAFQNDVLTSMLYDKRFDTLNLDDVAKIKLDKAKQQLSKAYEELGASDENTRKKIDEHFHALKISVDTIKKLIINVSTATNVKDKAALTDQVELNVEAIMPLPLLGRTQHIIDLSLEAENKKYEISRPIRQFLDIAGGFMDDKELTINPSSGMLQIGKGERKIPLLELSSGEKQLLILLIETLLQKNEIFVFLADEPEISLHIEWQAKVISSIRKLNASSQVIVATHSPEIAGGWKNQLIDMEDIISG